MQTATSLVKFFDQQSANGERIGWGRADIDGAPTIGQVPTLPEEELQKRLTKVGNPNNRIFDLSNENDNGDYLAVMDKIVNGWAQCLHVERQFLKEEKKWIVYIEWVEWFMRDGSPMHSQKPYMGQPND